MEDDWLVTGAFTIGKCAYSLGRFVRKPGKEIVEPFKAYCFKEPLAIRSQFKPCSPKQ
jgi:hypothetical protein